ncbi:SDR family NAD(P)-dependent oxidoreductase [Streptomyces johnsoniae]|uniref:SDR family oxidoreductase n=1 Tax=Streptomyces johnsoniae TaxID=3075532 RepID=A0ABU2S8V7_9ACTN|nr:SDR family oxidoreductase [Streptomyces sp. DSM 41886]MDT0445416.1 SDR family oxidoreductase [Streptomyces sp. DSM 41886]
MRTDPSSPPPTRRAWVTGGASGIGAEVARRLSDQGVDVVIVDRDHAALDAVQRLVPRARPLHLDVTDTQAVMACVEAAGQDALPDILINGVGGDTRRIPYEDLREADLTDAIAHNLLACFTLTRLCGPVMRERGWGRIVNLASIAGRTYSIFSNAAYVAAKAAVLGYTKQCAYELAAHGVTANAVAHGPIGTERLVAAWQDLSADRKAEVQGRLPMGRYGTVDEAAAAIVHLCGEDAGYTTGALVDVNGGLHIA